MVKSIREAFTTKPASTRASAGFKYIAENKVLFIGGLFIISILIGSALLFSVSPGFIGEFIKKATFGSQTITFHGLEDVYAENPYVSAGDEFSLFIGTESAISANTMSFKLDFDPDVFELVRAFSLPADSAPLLQHIDLANAQANLAGPDKEPISFLYKVEGGSLQNYLAGDDLIRFDFKTKGAAGSSSVVSIIDTLVLSIDPTSTDPDVVANGGVVTLFSQEDNELAQEIKVWALCMDTDKGIDRRVVGTCIDTFESAGGSTDSCSGDKRSVLEYSCWEGACRQTAESCTEDEVCSKGRCVNLIETCDDTDKGDNAFVFGYVENREEGDFSKTNDTCSDSKSLTESFCDPVKNSLEETGVECNLGRSCVEGMCAGIRCGDVNKDGVFDSLDIPLIERAIYRNITQNTKRMQVKNAAGLDSIQSVSYANANINLDTLVDGSDVALAERFVVGYYGLDSNCYSVICGDGYVQGDEECDDGNFENYDGCSQDCEIEQGWYCAGTELECLFDSHCDAGFVCRANKCVAKEGYCTGDDQCDAPFVCVNNGCVRCREKSDCSSGYDCVDNVCKIVSKTTLPEEGETPIAGPGVSGAYVNIYWSNNEQTHQTSFSGVTEENGFFAINIPPSGTFSVNNAYLRNYYLGNYDQLYENTPSIINCPPSNISIGTDLLLTSEEKESLLNYNSTVSGIVTDKKTGKPIEELSVMFYVCDEENGCYGSGILTNSSGAYSFKAPAGRIEMSTYAPNGGYYGYSISFDLSAEENKKQDIEMEPYADPTAVLSGKLLDSVTEAPVGLVYLYLTWHNEVVNPQKFAYYSTKTSEDGSFQFDLPAGYISEIDMYPERDQLYFETIIAAKLAIAEGEAIENNLFIEPQPAKTAKLVGYVNDSVTNAPLSGATVYTDWFESEELDDLHRATFNALTNENGYYEIEVPAGYVYGISSSKLYETYFDNYKDVQKSIVAEETLWVNITRDPVPEQTCTVTGYVKYKNASAAAEENAEENNEEINPPTPIINPPTPRLTLRSAFLVGKEGKLESASVCHTECGDTVTAVPVEQCDDGADNGKLRNCNELCTGVTGGTDTDSDGLYDEEEAAAGTNINEVDTDGDGLSDYEEVQTYGTDPLKPDTDGDGVSDSQEIADGTDPKVPQAPADGGGDNGGGSGGDGGNEPEEPECVADSDCGIVLGFGECGMSWECVDEECSSFDVPCPEEEPCPENPACVNGLLVEQIGIDQDGCQLPSTCCGDASCSGAEDENNCRADCWQCPDPVIPVCAAENLIAQNGFDVDGCVLPPTCCNDAVCEGDETAINCRADCFQCPDLDPACDGGVLIEQVGIDQDNCQLPKTCCGDDSCSGAENENNCWADCGECPSTEDPACEGGNLIVHAGVDVNDCSFAKTCCGDDSCSGDENDVNCWADCGVCPEDPVCEGVLIDQAGVGAHDCALPATCCGNGQCEGDETTDNCEADCPAEEEQCPDLILPFCEGGQLIDTQGSGANDCSLSPTCCGDGLCTGSETEGNCAADCQVVDQPDDCPVVAPPECVCEECFVLPAGIDENNCPLAPTCCGDTVCADTENAAICPNDCEEEVIPEEEPCPEDPVCDPGFLVAQNGVDNNNCQLPKTCCGDNECSGAEDEDNCWADCGECPGIENPAGCDSNIFIGQNALDEDGCLLSPTCCGDNVCSGAENVKNCRVDCFQCQAVVDPICDGGQLIDSGVDEDNCALPKTCCGDNVCTAGVENVDNCRPDCWQCPDLVNPACIGGKLIDQDARDQDGCLLSPTCCGDNVCSGAENVKNCRVDCFQCQAVVDPACDSNVFVDTPGVDADNCPFPRTCCGDNECSDNENVENCRADCWECPVPPVPVPDCSVENQIPQDGIDQDGCSLPSTCCGDNVCSGDETVENCRGDCFVCPVLADPACDDGILVRKDGVDKDDCSWQATCCGDKVCSGADTVYGAENVENCRRDCYECPDIVLPDCDGGVLVPQDGVDPDGCSLPPICLFDTTWVCSGQLFQTWVRTEGNLVTTVDPIQDNAGIFERGITNCPAEWAFECHVSGFSTDSSVCRNQDDANPMRGGNDCTCRPTDCRENGCNENEQCMQQPTGEFVCIDTTLDSDGDGLTNIEEIGYGTDPNNPDSDGDELSDSEEVKVYGTNPLVKDTDGDTFEDGREVLQDDTNPLDTNDYYVPPFVPPEGCGNGALEMAKGEECDDGANVLGDGCDPSCKKELVAFVTYTAPRGELRAGLLSGVAAADKICQLSADGEYRSSILAGQGKYFRALLSTSTASGYSRLSQDGAYYTYRSDRAMFKVADDYADLTDGTIDSYIRYDEGGVDQSWQQYKFVWTGGPAIEPNLKHTCLNWQSTNRVPESENIPVVEGQSCIGSGACNGRTGWLDGGNWIDYGTWDCSSDAMLYCIEYLPVCGDGTRDGAEECDFGESNSNNGYCKEDCTIFECGDGNFSASYEQCEDGNLQNGDGCNSQCQVEEGYVADPENPGSVKPNVCGDGVVCTNPDVCIPYQECDNGNLDETDSCMNDCTWNPLMAECGDGILGDAEQCEDNSGGTPGDGCDEFCQLESSLVDVDCADIEGSHLVDSVSLCLDEYGDMVTTIAYYDGEQIPQGQYCCVPPVVQLCGNGALDAGEECEDGNMVSGDGCDKTCTLEAPLTVDASCSDIGGTARSLGYCSEMLGNGYMLTANAPWGDAAPGSDGMYCCVPLVPSCGDGSCNGDEACSTCAKDCGICPPVCGNSIVEAGEVCDDGNKVAGDGCSAVCNNERFVFVTSYSYLGNLGGIAGADATCASHAEMSGSLFKEQGRKFVAWLSDSTTNARNRVEDATYYLLRKDGTREKVADNLADLTDGTIDAGALQITEAGLGVDNSYTWTGTSSNGNAVQLPSSQGTCLDWTKDSNSYTGIIGTSMVSSSAWTLGSQTPYTCNTPYALYCFEITP